ncbi:hypothetical protein ACFU99_43880, partial [Streptomyces sp. NPDC057654]
ATKMAEALARAARPVARKLHRATRGAARRVQRGAVMAAKAARIAARTARRIGGPLVRKLRTLARLAGRWVRASRAGHATIMGWRLLRKWARNRARRAIRAAGAGVLAVAAGGLAAVPGLVLALPAALLGALLRRSRLARPGPVWGLRFLRWGPVIAWRVWRRWMVRLRVAVAFPSPGRPLSASSAASTGGWGDIMSHFVRETETVRTAYAAYDPPSMLSVGAEYEGLPEGIYSVAEAIRQLAVNTADRYPADQRLADTVAAVYALVRQAGDAAADLYPTFAKHHEWDLARHETPRVREHMWNILERRLDGTYDRRLSLFRSSCEDIAHTYARNELTAMMGPYAVAAEYEGIPIGLENVAAAIDFLAVKSAEAYPVEKPVAEAVADIHHLLQRAISASCDLFPAFRRLHARDIQRHEAPRNGVMAEAMWDH